MSKSISSKLEDSKKFLEKNAKSNLSLRQALSALAEAERTTTELSSLKAKLRELAAGKPVYAWIETRDAKPAEIRAAVLAAIRNGATGIGYRGFEGAKGENPDAAVLAVLRKLNEQITAHAVELLADPAKAETLLR